ncbi:U32 family peptidase [uncultured Desulfobacter sp.]|uniref:peptidase U32 family protein n=1 Tax=uncultured Desulfobacter sp. TaxID=240139 RepID=UPI003749B05E
MPNTLKKIELLAPAGNFEKLEIAVHYGADAVYLGGKDFNLRNFSGNFTDRELEEAIRFAEKHRVKIYLTCNIYSRNHEQDSITAFLERIGNIGPHAVIISDPGIIFQARQIIPHIDIHLSTQANTTNYNAALFWEQQGIKRINLARELSLEEIKTITSRTTIQTEVFVHGAMCMSYSGRCLLSSFLSGRDSNRGLCSHPCRWNYAVMEELRPNEYFPVQEDRRGTYIFNSKDMCLIDHIPELIQAGISSLKIEGRMKGINYLGSVVKTYRNAIDAYIADPTSYSVRPAWHSELYQIYHRAYCTGFYFGHPDDKSDHTLNPDNTHKGKIHSFIGKIIEKRDKNLYLIDIRNKLLPGDEIEILSPQGPARQTKVLSLTNEQGQPVDNAKPNTHLLIGIPIDVYQNDIVRKL